VLFVCFTAVVFRVDGFVTIANELLVMVIYSMMIAAFLLGLFCVAFLGIAYVMKFWIGRG